MPSAASARASAGPPKCGCRREPGKRRTSTRWVSWNSRRRATKSSSGRVEWPIVQTVTGVVSGARGQASVLLGLELGRPLAGTLHGLLARGEAADRGHDLGRPDAV